MPEPRQKKTHTHTKYRTHGWFGILLCVVFGERWQQCVAKNRWRGKKGDLLKSQKQQQSAEFVWHFHAFQLSCRRECENVQG